MAVLWFMSRAKEGQGTCSKLSAFWCSETCRSPGSIKALASVSFLPTSRSSQPTASQAHAGEESSASEPEQPLKACMMLQERLVECRFNPSLAEPSSSFRRSQPSASVPTQQRRRLRQKMKHTSPPKRPAPSVCCRRNNPACAVLGPSSLDA